LGRISEIPWRRVVVKEIQSTKTVALIAALLIQTQARPKGFTRLRLHRHAPVVQGPSDSMGGRLSQMRAPRG